MPQALQAARPRRTQAERRDESGRGLLRAAASVIVEQGVSAATFEAIGARAGYSRGLATQRFGSKQGLIDSLIAFLHARQGEILQARGVDRMAGLEAILAYVDFHLRALNQDGDIRAYFMLLAGAVADLSAVRAAFAESHRLVERRLEALVMLGQRDGTIRPGVDPDAAALMIGSLLLGISIQSIVDPEMDLEPIRTTSLATLRLALAPAPSEGGAARP